MTVLLRVLGPVGMSCLMMFSGCIAHGGTSESGDAEGGKITINLNTSAQLAGQYPGSYATGGVGTMFLQNGFPVAVDVVVNNQYAGWLGPFGSTSAPFYRGYYYVQFFNSATRQPLAAQWITV